MTIEKPCAHHWQIPEATAPTSEGECTRCGETREFVNHMPDLDFGQLVTAHLIERKHEPYRTILPSAWLQ